MRAKNIYVLAILFTAVFAMTIEHAAAKEADLAGSWYSSSPKALKSELEKYLDNVEMKEIEGELIGVIVPHAGYRFSGSVAAYSYRAIQEKNPDKVILIGFTHRVHLPGRIAVFTDEMFNTPLGGVAIDTDLAKKFLTYDKKVQNLPQAFVSENSIELQIPFIQTALKDARVVILAIGDQDLKSCRLLADALYDILSEEKSFVIVASTDMSHYLPYGAASEKDTDTIGTIEGFDPDVLYSKGQRTGQDLMCGYGAVYSVMSVCKKLGADKVQILKYANSGDTSGMKGRVVGYLSAAFVKSEVSERKIDANPRNMRYGLRDVRYDKKEEAMFSREQRVKLLKIARDTIRHHLETGKRLDIEVDDKELKQDMGAFVTLHKHGQLRGCIGHIVATDPFYLTVRDMAISSAVGDPRFSPVKLDELDDIDIEISALTPMKKIEDYNEIVMGKHGVMVKKGFRSGVYLPQVADETGWDREQFMNSLCAEKAGIPQDSWKTDGCDIYTFTAEVFSEKTLKETR